MVLVAKHHAAARKFSLLMQEKQFTKTYVAMVWGWPEEDGFTINAPLRRQGEVRSSPIWLKRVVHPGGQCSETRVLVKERFQFAEQKFSMLELQAITGRMHQLRVHLSHVGFPIVGDKIYGPDERCYLDFIERGWTASLKEILVLPRQALHAWRLEIPRLHRTWTAPMPNDWTLG